jgi:hypothetical protein
MRSFHPADIGIWKNAEWIFLIRKPWFFASSMYLNVNFRPYDLYAKAMRFRNERHDFHRTIFELVCPIIHIRQWRSWPLLLTRAYTFNGKQTSFNYRVVTWFRDPREKLQQVEQFRFHCSILAFHEITRREANNLWRVRHAVLFFAPDKPWGWQEFSGKLHVEIMIATIT